MVDFHSILTNAIAAKGGYEKKPDAEKYRGILRSSFPNWKGWQEVDRHKTVPDFPEYLERNELLQEMVLDFYQRRFFNELFLFKLNSTVLACDVFEASTVIGRTLAVKLLQNAINLIIDPMSTDVPTDVDGIASEHLCNRANRCNQQELIACYTILVGAKVIGMGDYFRQWIKK